MADISFLVLLIMGISALVTYKGLQDYSFFSKYCFDIAPIRQGQFYRMVSAGFLHVDWMHYFFNMITLYFFADIVLAQVGPAYFLLIYFGSMVVGNLITYQIYYNTLNYRAVGASGAIMGVLYACIMMFPDMTLGIFFIIPMPSYLFAILYLFYSVYGMRNKSGSIGHSAHIGGALGGLILIIAKFPFLLIGQLWLVGLMLVPIAVLLYLYKTKRLE